MLELASAKVEVNPGINPVLRSWELWGTDRVHGRTMVYNTMHQLLEEDITKHFEENIAYEDQFTRMGLLKLLSQIELIPEKNELQRITKKKLRELVHELYRKLFGPVPQ